tara:strand:+ start:364 stop:873 length:510 start_codon:yes stop_codon:yes gene_type:complete
MNFFKLNLLGTLFLLFGVQSLKAQSSCNSDGWILPCNKSNTRFTNDYFDIPRPALSLRGFDNTYQDNFDHSQDTKVYGVRQLLERLYGINSTADQYAIDIIEYMQDVNNSKLFISDDNNNREYNGRLLETKAFLTLISFIIEENQGSGKKLDGFGNLGLPSHNTLRNEI